LCVKYSKIQLCFSCTNAPHFHGQLLNKRIYYTLSRLMLCKRKLENGLFHLLLRRERNTGDCRTFLKWRMNRTVISSCQITDFQPHDCIMSQHVKLFLFYLYLIIVHCLVDDFASPDFTAL